MKKFVLPCLMILSLSARAQNMFGVYFKAQSPKGSFQQNVKTVPVGMGLGYFHHIRDSRFSYGGELGISMYTDFTYQGTIPSGQSIKIYEEDCFWTAHGEVRYHFFQTETIKTYFQVRLGATTFFSSLQSDDPSVKYDKFSFHGTAFNTGFGAGMMINIRKLIHPGDDAGTAYLDLGATMHSGTATSYRYVEHDQNIPLNQGQFRSLTNYVDYRFGVLIGTPW